MQLYLIDEMKEGGVIGILIEACLKLWSIGRRYIQAEATKKISAAFLLERETPPLATA